MLAKSVTKPMTIVCCIESMRVVKASNFLSTRSNPAFISVRSSRMSASTRSKRWSTRSNRWSTTSKRLSTSSNRWLTFSLRSSSRSSVHASLAITAMQATIGGVLSTMARQMQIFWDDFRERVELAAGRLYEVLGSDQEKAQYRADEADDRADHEDLVHPADEGDVGGVGRFYMDRRGQR